MWKLMRKAANMVKANAANEDAGMTEVMILIVLVTTPHPSRIKGLFHQNCKYLAPCILDLKIVWRSDIKLCNFFWRIHDAFHFYPCHINEEWIINISWEELTSKLCIWWCKNLINILFLLIRNSNETLRMINKWLICMYVF